MIDEFSQENSSQIECYNPVEEYQHIDEYNHVNDFPSNQEEYVIEESHGHDMCIAEYEDVCEY